MPGAAKRVLACAVLLVAASIAAAPAGCADGDEGEAANERSTALDSSAGGSRTTAAGGAERDTDAGPGSAAAGWKRLPVLPTFGPRRRARLNAEVRRSRRAGMRAGVFAKVGDSNTDYPAQLHGLGCRRVVLAGRSNLRHVLRRYRRTRFPGLVSHPGCRPTNSFSRDSAATASNATSEWAITPAGEDGAAVFVPVSPECPDHRSPLECEIEAVEPRYVTIMIGSGDVVFGEPLGRAFAGNIRELIRTVRSLGPVPVLSTLPPVGNVTGVEDRRIAEANLVISRLARAERLPLINLWRALTAPGVVNRGLAGDGLHLGAFRGDQTDDILQASVIFTPEALRYGANRRNLIWLQALGRLDRAARAGG